MINCQLGCEVNFNVRMVRMGAADLTVRLRPICVPAALRPGALGAHIFFMAGNSGHAGASYTARTGGEWQSHERS